MKDRPGAGRLTVRDEESVVQLRRIRKIETYEVMEEDLIHIDQAMSEEVEALTFLGGSVSCLVGFGVALLTTQATGFVGSALAGCTLASLVASLFFAVRWRRRRRERPLLLERIRRRTRMEVEDAGEAVRTEPLQPGARPSS